MSNLGPHLRHNRHHTLLHRQVQPCSQFGLHMHDQQPTIYTCNRIFCISLYSLTTRLVIGFTTSKTLKFGTQKRLQIHAYHWLQISQISGFCYSRLQVGFTNQLPIGLHSISSWSSHARTSTSCWLTCRRYLQLQLYPIDSLDLRLGVDLPQLQPVVSPPQLRLVVNVVKLPQLRPSVDSPRLDFHCKEYNNPTFSHLLSSLLKQEILELSVTDPRQQFPLPLCTKRTSQHSQTWSMSLLCFPTCLLSPIAPCYFPPCLLRNGIVHQCA
jgi:hypothetical protein